MLSLLPFLVFYFSPIPFGIAFLFLDSQLHEAEKESSHTITWDFLRESFHHLILNSEHTKHPTKMLRKTEER